MSAYIVNDNHINVIVSYFISPLEQNQLWIQLDGNFYYMDKDTMEKVAYALHAENVRSVNDHYHDTTVASLIFQYLPTVREYYTIGEIAGALDCLEYQSCETDDYYTTDAYRLITNMRKHLLKKIQGRENADTWEITEVKGKHHAIK